MLLLSLHRAIFLIPLLSLILLFDCIVTAVPGWEVMYTLDRPLASQQHTFLTGVYIFQSRNNTQNPLRALLMFIWDSTSIFILILIIVVNLPHDLWLWKTPRHKQHVNVASNHVQPLSHITPSLCFFLASLLSPLIQMTAFKYLLKKSHCEGTSPTFGSWLFSSLAL